MKDNVSKIVKKVLLEQVKTPVITDPNMKLAWDLGCYDELVKRTKGSPSIANKNNAQVYYLNDSKSKPGYPVVWIYPPNSTTGIGNVEYYSADEKTKYTQEGSLTWYCENIPPIVQNSMKTEFTNFINNYRNSNPGQDIFSYSDTGVTESSKVDGTCKLVKLSDYVKKTNRTDLAQYLPGQELLIWECSSAPSKAATNKADIQRYTDAGYRKCTAQDLALTSQGTIKRIDISGVPLCIETNKKDVTGAPKYKTNPIYTELNKYVKLVEDSTPPKPSDCRKLLISYGKAAEAPLSIDCLELSQIKTQVKACLTPSVREKLGGFLNFSKDKIDEIIRKLESADVKDRYGNSLAYSPYLKGPCESNINESKLKNIINQNLNEISENKKKSLIQEHNIIKNRFLLITENGKPKTKKQEEKFIDDLLNEMFYLKKQGFNETLINEQFLDVIKGLFGSLPEGIFSTLKERFAAFILNQFGVGTEGYLANIVVAAVGNIPIGDYFNGKVFNCNYLSDVLSKSIGSGIARKIQHEEGMTGGLYDIIRIMLINSFTNTEFGDKIENFIGDLICPKLSGIKEKMSIAGEKIKDKALS